VSTVRGQCRVRASTRGRSSPSGRRSARAGRLPLGELLPRVDALTLHCPLTEDPRGMLGAAELALLKPGAFLVNTARGGLVDEQAMADALRGGHLG
ncbi:NAD(P)-dependent oxidoreductase, partial [Pseudomonas aeruginosa]